MNFFDVLALSTALALAGQAALGQTTPDELRQQIDARSTNLDGFQQLLNDPDPRRSLAAVEGMLASGDPNLERMALEFGLTNPDPMIRATALRFHLEKLPSIAVDFDASALSEDDVGELNKILSNLGGSIGPDRLGSFSIQPGDYKDDIGCFPHASNSRICAMRIGTGSLSLHFGGSLQVAGRWANLHADESGMLRGGVSLSYQRGPDISLPLTVRIIN